MSIPLPMKSKANKTNSLGQTCDNGSEVFQADESVRIKFLSSHYLYIYLKAAIALRLQDGDGDGRENRLERKHCHFIFR